MSKQDTDFKIIVILLLFINLVFTVGTWNEVHAGDYRIGGMNKSDHWDKDGEYNEQHGGVFGEARLCDDCWLGFMDYENSFDTHSQAIYYHRDIPITDFERLMWGYQFGMVSGYEYIDPAPWFAITVTLCIMECDSDNLNAAGRVLLIPGVVNAYEGYVEF